MENRRKESSTIALERPLVPSDAMRTLAVDVGGSGIKASVLDSNGKPLTERVRVPTPRPATPARVVAAIAKLARSQGPFERVSVGFPGVVKAGVVVTAPNLDPKWHGHDLARMLRTKLSRPVRVANDAEIQAFAVVSGKGVEMMLTFGTGVGSALCVDGRMVPGLELGHHPFRKGKTYEEELGHAALGKVGKKRWNKRVREAVELLARIFNYRILYLGGGNAKFIKLELPDNVKVVRNVEGVLGGIALWRDDAG